MGFDGSRLPTRVLDLHPLDNIAGDIKLVETLGKRIRALCLSEPLLGQIDAPQGYPTNYIRYEEASAMGSSAKEVSRNRVCMSSAGCPMAVDRLALYHSR